MRGFVPAIHGFLPSASQQSADGIFKDGATEILTSAVSSKCRDCRAGPFQGQSTLAVAHERPHSGGMANKNVFAIAAITIFLMVGVVVALGVLATIAMLLYTVVAFVFSHVFGIELPHLH